MPTRVQGLASSKFMELELDLPTSMTKYFSVPFKSMESPVSNSIFFSAWKSSQFKANPDKRLSPLAGEMATADFPQYMTRPVTSVILSRVIL